MEKKLQKYLKTDLFEVIDIISIPHPYCITEKHVSFASNYWRGILSKESILEAEGKKKARCGMKNCNLDYGQHEQALLINCKTENKEELHRYLCLIKDMAIKDGFAGFAFKKGF